MKVTKEQISKWIDDYLENCGDKVHQRKWKKKYIYLHAPFNNSEDCYHKWLDWVDENKERLTALPTFEDILTELYEKEMKGIGNLTRYDTATLLAFPDNKFPHKVYLSAGAAKGARAIDVIGLVLDKSVFVNICPDFRKLTEAQIEDFLCIYKSYLNGEIKDTEEIASKCCRRSKPGMPKCC